MHIRPHSIISQSKMIVIDCLDDVSVSSTFEVRSLKTKPQRCGDVNCHVVGFNEAANMYYEKREFSKEDTEALWYRSEDYRKFKREFAMAVKEIVRIEIQNKKNPKSYHNVMEHVYQVCCSSQELDAKDSKNFDKWVAVAVSRVGLEKAVVRSIREDKSNRRRELWDSILEIQSDAGYYSTQESAAMIACVAQEISKASVLFATRLGQAQCA